MDSSLDQYGERGLVVVGRWTSVACLSWGGDLFVGKGFWGKGEKGMGLDSAGGEGRNADLVREWVVGFRGVDSKRSGYAATVWTH